MDGAVDTPLERPGRTVEVEGRLEEEEVSMMGWSHVRRKKGQVETDVVAGSRGWEEHRRKFPHLAYEQRRERYEQGWKAWLAGGEERREREMEDALRKLAKDAQKEKVEKWLRGGGEWE